MVAKPVLTRIWADGADPGKVVDPDVKEAGKFDDGWDAEIPPFECFNFLQNLFTKGLAHINERGICEWDSSTQYQANISYVTSPVNGLVYRAKTTNTGNEPSVSPTQWGVYPAAQPAASTSVSGIVELADNTETQTGTDGVRAVTPAGLTSRTATTSRSGIAPLATQTEVNAGADPNKIVTPNTLANRTATETRAGVTRYSTDGEAITGTVVNKATTPANVAAIITALGFKNVTVVTGQNINGQSNDGYIIFDSFENPGTPTQKLALQWVQGTFVNNISTNRVLNWVLTFNTVFGSPMVTTAEGGSAGGSGNSGYRLITYAGGSVTVKGVATSTGTTVSPIAWAAGYVTPP